MQANPLSTSVARSFLTEHARAPLEAEQRHHHLRRLHRASRPPTAPWSGSPTPTVSMHAVDGRTAARTSRRPATFDLVSEHGQSHIDNPVNALVVRTSTFESTFARFNLYFYDQTGRVLLPDPVLIPRSEQTATNRCAGCSPDPGRTLAEVTRSALPQRTDLDLSVVVTESGVAEVPCRATS